MIILGIDPGIAIVGYGVLEYTKGKFRTLAMGSVETPAGIDVEERLQMIYDDMCELIETYRPDEMAIEELFFNTNQKTAIAVAQARGVILLSAVQRQVKIREYTPLQVKQSVVGYGRAEKKQVIALVKMMLGLDNKLKLDDTADALALAICHAHATGSAMRDYFNQKKKKLL
ncbi:MAG: crossover junction endodeoxyribonuclease RuvC [Clostridia bacterium]|nr:crossover junction endodeoxyribonuclease RuvC [Clostridia bacterium]